MKGEEACEMTKRRAIPTAPELLEAYARHFDGLFSKSNQGRSKTAACICCWRSQAQPPTNKGFSCSMSMACASVGIKRRICTGCACGSSRATSK